MSLQKGETLIEMKLIPDPTDPGLNILELKIKAPKSPEPTPIPEVKIPTLIYIDDTIEEEQLPLINHALTDTVNRVTWPEQIQLVTAKHQLPNHLETVEFQNDDIFQVASAKSPCNLLVITNNESKDLKRQIAKASEFLTDAHAIQPTTTMELIDTLNDHVKFLKPKTLVNVKIEIELPNIEDSLEPRTYIPYLSKQFNKYSVNLIDLAAENVVLSKFDLKSNSVNVVYSYEELVIGREIRGGQALFI